MKAVQRRRWRGSFPQAVGAAETWICSTCGEQADLRLLLEGEPRVLLGRICVSKASKVISAKEAISTALLKYLMSLGHVPGYLMWSSGVWSGKRVIKSVVEKKR